MVATVKKNRGPLTFHELYWLVNRDTKTMVYDNNPYITTVDGSEIRRGFTTERMVLKPYK